MLGSQGSKASPCEGAGQNLRHFPQGRAPSWQPARWNYLVAAGEADSNCQGLSVKSV